jgi:hypothetical protein
VDVGVLQRKLTGWECPEVFDTLKIARRPLPDEGSYKLGNMVETLNLAHLEAEVCPNAEAGRVVIFDRCIPSGLA